MNRYLITGVAGFIGLALCRRLLAAGHRVVGLDDFSRGPRDSELQSLRLNNNFTFYECNLAQAFPAEIVGEFDVVFHFAGAVGVEDVISKPYSTYENNLRILFTVTGWLKKQQVKKFVYASSSEVYGWNPDVIVPTPENVALIAPPADMPRGGYALSKISGEFLTTTKCQELAIPFTIARLHNIYGPRMGHSHVIPQLIKKIAHASEFIQVHNSAFTRSFCFIQDALDQMLALSDVCHNEIINVGDDQEEIEIGQLAHLIAQQMNKSITIQNENTASDPFKRRCPDMTKSKSLLGVSARTSLVEGLALTIAWYQENC